MKSVRLVAVLALLGAASTAHAEWGVLGGINIFSPKAADPSVTSFKANGKMAIAGGLYLARNFTPKFKLELDALYVQRKFQVTGTGLDNTLDSTALQIPLIARFNFNPFWNIGVGLYYEMALGDKIKQTAGVDTTYSARELKKSDYGALGSLQFRIPAGPVKILIDGRYVYGLTEQDTNTADGSTSKNRYIQAFAGIGWGW